MSNFILVEESSLTLVVRPPGAPARFSLETAAHLTGVPAGLLRQYSRHALFGSHPAAAGSEPTFDVSDLYELRRAEAWRRRHGLNRRAVPVICGLLRELERLQAELRFARRP
jgi:hypothetical protein